MDRAATALKAQQDAARAHTDLINARMSWWSGNANTADVRAAQFAFDKAQNIEAAAWAAYTQGL